MCSRMIACHDEIDATAFAHHNCCDRSVHKLRCCDRSVHKLRCCDRWSLIRAANAESVRAGEFVWRWAEVACTVRGRLGRSEDVLPNEWQACRDQGNMQAVHDPGWKISAV